MGILPLSKSASLWGLDISEVALFVCGVVLVIGLIGEVRKSEKWQRHVKMFEMMVILGVAGELIADGGVFLFSRHLQTIADADLARVTTDVGNTRLAADKAADAADRANDSAKKASGEAGIAKQQAEEVGMLAAKANREAKQLGKQLRDEESKRLALERGVQEVQEHGTPRTVTKEMWQEIQTLRGKIKAVNVAYETDADTEIFAAQLASALVDAGIKVGFGPRSSAIHTMSGIFLYDKYAFDNPGGEPTKGEPLMGVLKSLELSSGGILAVLPEDLRDFPPDVPILIVGGRNPLKYRPPYFPSPEEQKK